MTYSRRCARNDNSLLHIVILYRLLIAPSKLIILHCIWVLVEPLIEIASSSVLSLATDEISCVLIKWNVLLCSAHIIDLSSCWHLTIIRPRSWHLVSSRSRSTSSTSSWSRPISLILGTWLHGRKCIHIFLIQINLFWFDL